MDTKKRICEFVDHLLKNTYWKRVVYHPALFSAGPSEIRKDDTHCKGIAYKQTLNEMSALIYK